MTTCDAVIRKATTEDLHACADLIASDSDGQADEWLERFTQVLHDPQRRFLVADLSGEVVGFGHLRHVRHAPESSATTPEGWYLSGVTVAASHRRRGIGLLLTQERLRMLQDLTDCAYYLAEATNTATLALHERLGFVQAGEVHLPGYEEALQLHVLDLASR